MGVVGGKCNEYGGEGVAKLGSEGTLWTQGGANNMGFGAQPISKRVHGVHFGSSVTYPFQIHATYGAHYQYVTFPQDVRNCEKCHPASTTSGTWKTNPNRLACNGCHDSDSAAAHTATMTWDPTPYFDKTGAGYTSGPFSGDEREACATCHAD